MPDPINRPDIPSTAYAVMRTRWQLSRDVRAGTEVLRARRATYLPRFEAETDTDWAVRVQLTYAYTALHETINAMVGLAFQVDPTLQEDVPPLLAQHWENLDGEGTHGAVFAQQCLDSMLQDGHVAILADYPDVADGLTLAQQTALDIRSYLVRVRIDQVLSWRVIVHGGRRRLGQVVIQQDTAEPAGDFGTQQVTRYRVYRQMFDPTTGEPFVEWDLWERAAGGGATDPFLLRRARARLRGPQWIPLSIAYGGQPTAILESEPPLLGLAYTNLHHTQLQSDQAMNLHVAGVVIPVFIGREKTGQTGERVTFSPTRGVDVGLGGDAKLLEAAGTSLAARRLEIEDTEKRMASQGLSLLQRDVAAAETATATTQHRRREESKLARAVRSLQDALEASLQFMAEYEGLGEGGSLVIRRDFAALTLSPDDLAQLRGVRQDGDLSLETFLSFLRQRGGAFEALDPVQEAEAVRREQAERLPPPTL